MSKRTIQSPFFMFNPKSYLYGEPLYELAQKADKLAQSTDISIFLTAPVSELSYLTKTTEHLIITAQYVDDMQPGRGMGGFIPESARNAGVQACVLNHAEKPVNYATLEKLVLRLSELDIITIVCASSPVEAKAIALLNPDIILCEPTELIGSKQVSPDNYIKDTKEAIHSVNENILVMQGAGISSSEDILKNLNFGANGNGVTSGITEAEDPEQTLEEMIQTTAGFKVTE
jgi:triosephosphate isomerase